MVNLCPVCTVHIFLPVPVPNKNIGNGKKFRILSHQNKRPIHYHIGTGVIAVFLTSYPGLEGAYLLV